MDKSEMIETPPSEAMKKAAETRNPIRKLYYWTLHWANTKYALPALFILSFAESSFFPIPPDVLLIAMCFSAPKHWFRNALWCTIASVLGGLLGYAIGWGLWEGVGQPIVQAYHGEAVIEQIRGWYDEYGFVGIIAAAITPIPYKVFTIASGLFEFNILAFTIASVIGRGVRFFFVAGLIRAFGQKVKPFIEERLELVMIVGTIVGILGFVALKFLR